MTVSRLKAKSDQLVNEQARVRALLATAGITCALIDKAEGFGDGVCRSALREPNARAEKAIAAALFTFPHLLWPSRYHPDGKRRRPQNYSRVPTFEQRRNAEGTRT